MKDERAYAAIVAAFAAFLYLAFVVAGFGFISLLTDTEVISDPSIGPLVGPVMTGAAVVTLFILLVVFGTRVGGDEQRVAPSTAFGVGVACYLVFVVAGGVAGAVADPGNLLRYVLFAVGQLASWYAVTVGIAAVLVTLLYQLVLVGRFRQRGRPRWPWEHDE